VLVVAAGLLTGVGCSSGGAGSVPARSTEQVAAQRPQAVGNTLPAPTLASPAFPAVCNFVIGPFGQVEQNAISCNLPEPGSTASIQVPLPKYLYSDPIQSDCSTAHLTAVVNQGTDTYGTSVSLSPDYLPGNSSCIGVGATTVTVTRGPGAFYYGHPGAAYQVSSNFDALSCGTGPRDFLSKRCPQTTALFGVTIDFNGDPSAGAPSPTPISCGQTPTPIIILSRVKGDATTLEALAKRQKYVNSGSSCSTPNPTPPPKPTPAPTCPPAKVGPDPTKPIAEVDDQGHPVTDAAGVALYRPDNGHDPQFYVNKGRDANPRGLPNFIPDVNTLKNFAQGASWDDQRVPGPEITPIFLTIATVNIGFFGAAAHIPANELLLIEETYIIGRRLQRHRSLFGNSDFGDVPYAQFPFNYLPQRNVDETLLGYRLYKEGLVGNSCHL